MLTQELTMQLNPPWLNSPPEIFPPSPVFTRAQTLPYHELSWENFERLILRIVRREATVAECWAYGERGQKQYGLDILAELRNAPGKFACYQCKRVEKFSATDINKAVDTFLQGKWACKTKRFVLCTSLQLTETQQVDEISKQRNVLTTEQIRLLNRNCLVCETDITQANNIEMMVEKTIHKFGKVDILVNNAGMNIRKRAIDLTEPEWDRVLNTNLKSYFFCAQAVAREMAKRNGGKIINISSIRSVIAPPMAPAYTASKGGVSQLTKALAVEWAPFNIRVNAIAPGYTETELTAHFKEKEKDLYEKIRERTALKRWGLPEDFAGTLIYLASDASDYMTGQTLYVDGGYLLT